MTENKKIACFCMMILTGALLFFCNIPTAQAAYESSISIPLYGDGYTIKSGELKLEFPSINSEGTLTYIPSGSSDIPFHSLFPGERYLGVNIIRNGNVIFTISADGDTKQDVFKNKINKLTIKDTDIIRFYFLEPYKQQVNNFDQTTSLPSDPFKIYFYTYMYYMMTYGGFIPVNNGISHYIYDQYKGNTSATQISSLFSNNILNFGYSGLATPTNGFKFFGTVEPDTKFHTKFPGENYFGISQYKITADHQLGDPITTANALGDTTYSNMGNQLNKIPVKIGTIYKIFSAEPKKIRIWRDGIQRGIKDTSKKETYVELTKTQGLVELDFSRVTSKAVTIELGSPPETIKVEDFTNVSGYPSLSSSFKTNIKTDKVGTYDQEISIRENLLTASNYLLSTVSSKVTVVDTTPPKATAKANVNIPIYGSLPSNPSELVDNLNDNSKIEDLKLEYLNESGDTSVPGIKQVKIRITDASNNFTDVTVNVTIVPGSLTIKSVPSIHFGKIKIGDPVKSTSQNGEFNAVMSVDDLRGTKAGWKLQASMSDFTDQDGKRINAQIALLKGVVSNTDNKIDGLTTFDAILNNNLQTIVRAEQGSGMKNSTATFKNEDIALVNISPDAKIGSYEATINWVLLDTP